MSEERKVRATITFFGEPYPIPEPGERVALRVADGSWREGFRCVSEPLEAEGEKVVWVAHEQEYRAADHEGRMLAGDTWPISQIAPTAEGY